MKVYVAFSTFGALSVVVEVFTEERKANAFAFWYKTAKGVTLKVEPREVRDK